MLIVINKRICVTQQAIKQEQQQNKVAFTLFIHFFFSNVHFAVIRSLFFTSIYSIPIKKEKVEITYQFCTFDVRSLVYILVLYFPFFSLEDVEKRLQSGGGVQRFSRVTVYTPNIFRLNNRPTKPVQEKYVYLSRDVQKQPIGQNDVNVRNGEKVGI